MNPDQRMTRRLAVGSGLSTVQGLLPFPLPPAVSRIRKACCWGGGQGEACRVWPAWSSMELTLGTSNPGFLTGNMALIAKLPSWGCSWGQAGTTASSRQGNHCCVWTEWPSTINIYPLSVVGPYFLTFRPLSSLIYGSYGALEGQRSSVRGSCSSMEHLQRAK